MRGDHIRSNTIGIVIGTGPSLTQSIPAIEALREQGAILFAVNNTFDTFELTAADHWIACDPAWHELYSPVNGPFEKWHWNEDICSRYGYRFIHGRWIDGLSLDPESIAYNHCSSAQALNLAVHQARDPILLVGHDFTYSKGRHYFTGLSDEDGEYPEQLRKFSTFDGLIECYRHIGEQRGLPQIINCTPGSRLPWFPMKRLEDYVN